MIDILVNNTFYTAALFDTGCLPFAAFSERFVDRKHLAREPITHRELKLAADSNDSKFRNTKRTPVCNIDSMTYATIDINGRQERIYGYVIPGLHYDIILGKGWCERNDVKYKAKKRQLRIGGPENRVTVRERGWIDEPHVVERTKSIRTAHLVTARVFNAEIKRAKADETSISIGSVTIEDVNKALEKLNKRKNKPTLRSLRNQLPDALKDEAQYFMDDDDDVVAPHRPGWDHAINIEVDDQGRPKRIPYGPLYDMSREELLVLRKTLTDYLDKGWIRASSSPAGAPVLFARKPGGGLRFCVDYRALNAITRSDRYPLPLIRETLRQLTKAKWITKVDIRAAFHRLRIREGDEWKTAFRTRYGQFEWLVTPFGLTGAPATFQRYINSTLQDLLDVYVSAYMDDVIIYSDGTYEDHIDKVKVVVQRLGKAGLQIDIEKCAFAVKEVKYLGFVIRAGEGITVDPEKVEAIKLWETPENASAVRSFLGFANFYREFIPLFATIAAPLNRLTRHGAAFTWGKEERTAFERLKDHLISSPLLMMFDPELETILEADASGYAIGACLSQTDAKGRLRPVGFFSRKMTPSESNYEIHDKELLAIVAAMAHFRGELRSVANKFSVLSDHKNLRYFMTTQRLTERQARWSEILSQYNFKLAFRAGKDSGKPDFLSRRPQDRLTSQDDERLKNREFRLIKDAWLPPPTDQSDTATVIHAVVVAPVEAREGQQSSPTATHAEDAPGPPKDLKTPPEGNHVFTSPELQSLWDKAIISDETFCNVYASVARGDRALPPGLGINMQAADCEIDGRGVLLYRGSIWVPDHEPLRTALVQQTHDSHITGHPGRNITGWILQRNYFWPQQYKSVRRFCRNCNVCGRSKVWRQAKQGLLRPLPVPDRFFSELSIDFMTELPGERDAPRNMMVLVDRALGTVTLEPMESMEAEICAEKFVWNHFRFHGFPNFITSDRGSNWVGKFWTRLCQLVRVEQRLSTAYHPQTDGQTERMNQEVLAYLRAFITYAQDDWPQLLPMAQLAINNRPNAKTGLSPFFVLHAYHAEPIQQPPPPTPKTASDPKVKAENFVTRLHEAQEMAQAAMATAQQIMEHQANRSRRPAERFQVGDKVWLNLKNVSTPQLKKKLAWTHAKYEITKMISPDVYELNVPSNIRKRFFVDLLRRADTEDPLPSQKVDDTQPPPLLDGPDPLWAVERILRADKFGNKRKVLVKWTEYIEPTWEPRENLVLTDAFKAFIRKYGENDNVGEDGVGAFTGATGKKKKKSAKKKQTALQFFWGEEPTLAKEEGDVTVLT